MNDHTLRVRGRFDTPLIQGRGIKPPKRPSPNTTRFSIRKFRQFLQEQLSRHEAGTVPISKSGADRIARGLGMGLLKNFVSRGY